MTFEDSENRAQICSPPTSEETETQSTPSRGELDDDMALRQLGYEKKLHRGLSAFQNFAIGFTEVGFLASFTALYGYGLSTGGPVVIFWSFFASLILTTTVGYSMAEICSAYPSAGSVYSWSAQVVPEKYAPLAAYICGWFNFVGNATCDASYSYSFASMLSSTLQITTGTGFSQNVIVAVSILTIYICSVLNIFRVDQVGWINTSAAIFQLSSIVIIVVGGFLTANKLSTSETVFTKYYNDTGFKSPSYVVCLGLLTPMFTVSGYEASGHMAEETQGATKSAPNGIIYNCFLSSLCGLLYAIAMLYITTDIEKALYGETDSAVVNVFLYSCGRTWGIVLSWLVVGNLFLATNSSVTVTGRITYALARDKAFPYSETLSQVNKTFDSPLNSIFAVSTFNALILCIALIPKNGETAFNSIAALSTIGYQVSYAIPIILKVIFDPTDFPKTELSLGSWSRPLGIISTIWLLGTAIVFFFPSTAPVTKTTMNWSSLIVGTLMIISAIHWIAKGRHSYDGPRRSAGISARNLTTPTRNSIDELNRYHEEVYRDSPAPSSLELTAQA